MTQIILIRHGQTIWNKEERVRGQVEVPLDETGLAQAELTAARVVQEWKPAAVYCSPLQRAVQTAQPIAQRLHLEVHRVAGLNDMNFGEWQGLAVKEIEQRWPDTGRAWLRAPHTVTFPNGESLQDLRQRSVAAVLELAERHADSDVVVVAHTVVNRVLLLAALGLDNSNYWRIGQDTCAINLLRWRRGVFFIESLNDTCHLKDTGSRI